MTSPSATVVSEVCNLSIAPSLDFIVVSLLGSKITDFSAGAVQNICLVPLLQLTALSLLLDCNIVVLAKVVPLEVYVPTPTSKLVPSVQQ